MPLQRGAGIWEEQERLTIHYISLCIFGMFRRVCISVLINSLKNELSLILAAIDFEMK